MNAIQLSRENGKYYRYIGKIIIIDNDYNISSSYIGNRNSVILILITEQLVVNICHLLYVLQTLVEMLMI